MIIVGLTGGIASGKTFVSSYLKKNKIPVHESDEVVRSIYKKQTKTFIACLFKIGFSNIITSKKINKKKIREEVFENKIKKNKLERYLHKEIEKNRKKFLGKNKNKEIVFLDIPLLFEKKLEKTCDLICSTTAPLKTRKIRALKRPGINIKILNKILKNQTKESVRREKSHYIIDTSKTKKKTCLQVDYVICDILKNRKEKK